MGSIFYDIAAVLINALNLYIFFSRSRLFIYQTRIFALLLLVSFAATLMDIITVVTYWGSGLFSVWFLYGLNILFYLFQNSIAPIFAMFILSLGGRLIRMKALRRLVLYAPLTVSFCIILSTPITGLAFSFDDSLKYTRGPALTILYTIALFYTLYVVFSLITERRRLPKETKLAVFLFLPFSLVSATLQYFNPSLLVQNTGIALSELIILLTIQDFGKYVAQTSGLFNCEGLLMQLEYIMRKRIPFTTLLISLDSVEFFRIALGPQTFSDLEHENALRLFGTPSANCFAAQLGAGTYLLVELDRGRIQTRCDDLITLFKCPWNIQGHLISFSAHICMIRFPEDTKSLQTIFKIQYHLSGKLKSYSANTILTLAELSLDDAGRILDVTQVIKRSLESSGFDVYFQPIVDSHTNRVLSAEALVRLHDDALGWISPAEFIPIAEQNGTIYQIGEFVMERSCAFLAQLRSSGLTLDYIEINLSALQCVQSNLCERVNAISRRYGLLPRDICFEITETATHHSPVLIKKNIDALAAAGYSIAIDDFGTGYSNIANLMAIPFSLVKLDRSLIAGLEDSNEERIGLEELLAVFSPLQAELVAEGVETLAQLKILKGYNIRLIQGYCFSRPLPGRDFITFLRKGGAECI